MKNMKIWALLAGLSVLAVLGFAPPGVTFSNSGYLYPSETGISESSSTDTLIVTGEGVTDDGTLAASDSTTGIYVFDIHETTGLELHFALEGAAGVTGTARVWRAIPVRAGPRTSSGTQWTYRHLCDVSLIASSQEGVASGVVGSTFKWATVSVTSDAGLSPLGTRTLNGTTAGAAGSLFVDPLCASNLVVQVKRDTASGIKVLASDWTRN